MDVSGLQKLTLLDYPGKTACTVFTRGCNLRCPFCHNASLVLGNDSAEEELIDEREIFAFLKKRIGLLDGVCITGGEPLLQNGIEAFMRRAKELGFLVKLDTNGFFPERLEAILSEKLADYVAMDIKSSEEGYGAAVGIENIDGGFARVKRSIDVLRGSGIDYEFRTTAVKGLHTKEDIEAIGEWLCGEKKYFLQMYTDSGDTIGARINPGGVRLGAFDKEEAEELLEVLRKYIPKAQLRGI